MSELLKSMTTRVVGVSFDNDDGTSRQDIISIIVEISPRTDDHSSHHAIIILFVLGFKQVCDSDLQCNRYRFKLKQCR